MSTSLSLSYEEALKKLEEQIKIIESPETPLVQVQKEISEALQLIDHCRKMLREGENEYKREINSF